MAQEPHFRCYRLPPKGVRKIRWKVKDETGVNDMQHMVGTARDAV